MGFRNFVNFLVCAAIVGGVVAAVPGVRTVFVGAASFFALVWTAENLMTFTRRFFLKKTVEPEGKAVFVTGCDSGFGHMLVQRLDNLGYTVFAGCLFEKGEGAVSLVKSCSPRVQIVPLDVTSDKSVHAAKDFVTDNLGANVLWAVVNNAGVAMGGELEWTPLEDVLKMQNVNCNGTLRVTKAFLPFLRNSKGRLVNNTSACGEFICPGFVGYCMSKSAAIALTVGLRVEMKKWEVRAISIQPFFYRTPLTQENNCIQLIEKFWSQADPEMREDYGEEYKTKFIESTQKVLNRGSFRIQDVVDCFEDAITSEDPLDTYRPAYLPDKLGIKILQSFPNSLRENYQKLHMEGFLKPAALSNDKTYKNE